MTYKIPVNPQAGLRYRIAFPSDTVPSESYRSASIGAAEEKLIDTLAALRPLLEEHNGYLHSSVTFAIGQIEDSLMLLDAVRQRAREGDATSSVLGATPVRAVGKLHTYHAERADRHILRNAKIGMVHWFAAAHWNRLKELDASLYESLHAKFG